MIGRGFSESWRIMLGQRHRWNDDASDPIAMGLPAILHRHREDEPHAWPERFDRRQFCGENILNSLLRELPAGAARPG